MFNRRVLLRFRRTGVASIILAVALLVSPILGAQAQWMPFLQAPIQVASGAIVGTATFTPVPSGGVQIQVQVTGFDPIAGSHRVAIANGGACYLLSWWCASSEVLVLPDMQFYPNGSADYTTVTGGVSMNWLAQTPGAALIIHADTNAGSQVIGRGVISPVGGPYWGWAPGPMPPAAPPSAPPPWQPPQPPGPPPPPPVQVVGRFRVVASDGLRLRTGPGTWYTIRRVVPWGTILQATGVQQWGGGLLWAKVVYGGTTYWAAKAWLQAY